MPTPARGGRRASVEQYEDDGLDPVFPYDRRTMTRVMTKVGFSGKEYQRKRKVARNYEDAIDNAIDYWHPGGELRTRDGRYLGWHARGWFIGGYMWADDPPEILELAADYPTLTGE